MSASRGPFKDEQLATITVDRASGRPVVSPAVIMIRRGGTVRWTCAEGDWEIELKQYDAGPFSDRARRSVAGGRGSEEGDTIHDEADRGGEPRNDPGAPAGARGRYRYSVRVRADGEEYEDDPDMVVGPGN